MDGMFTLSVAACSPEGACVYEPATTACAYGCNAEGCLVAPMLGMLRAVQGAGGSVTVALDEGTFTAPSLGAAPTGFSVNVAVTAAPVDGFSAVDLVWSVNNFSTSSRVAMTASNGVFSGKIQALPDFLTVRFYVEGTPALMGAPVARLPAAEDHAFSYVVTCGDLGTCANVPAPVCSGGYVRSFTEASCNRSSTPTCEFVSVDTACENGCYQAVCNTTALDLSSPAMAVGATLGIAPLQQAPGGVGPANQAVVVRQDVRPPGAVSYMNLIYTSDDGITQHSTGMTSVAVSADGTETFEGTLPAVAAGSRMRFDINVAAYSGTSFLPSTPSLFYGYQAQ